MIHLHPADLEVIQKLPAIDSVSQGRTVSYVADSNLNRGDCSAKAGEISVIYNLRRQVEEIRRQLLSTVGGHAET